MPFLRELFMQRLPPNVRMVLASADATIDLYKLADMADKVMEVITPTVPAICDTSTDVLGVKQLREEVAHLTDFISSLSSQTHHHSSSRSSSRSQQCHSPAPPRLPSSDSLCWYHDRFREAACKCKDPCTWGNAQASH